MKRKQRKVKIKICPNCKKAGIGMFIGWETGNYQCDKCGYIGPVIVEIEKRKKRSGPTRKL